MTKSLVFLPWPAELFRQGIVTVGLILTLASLSTASYEDIYRPSFDHESTCNSWAVRVHQDLTFCGLKAGTAFRVYRRNTILASYTVPTGTTGMFELVQYPERNNETYLVAAIDASSSISSGMFWFLVNRTAINSGIFNYTTRMHFARTKTVAIDYNHRLLYSVTEAGQLQRWNITDPNNLVMISSLVISTATGGKTSAPACCSPYAIFDNRLAIGNPTVSANGGVTLWNVSSTEITFSRFYGNSAGTLAVWKDPASEYILATEPSGGYLRGLFLTSGTFANIMHVASERPFWISVIRQLNADLVGIGSGFNMAYVYLNNLLATESFGLMRTQATVYDFYVSGGLVYISTNEYKTVYAFRIYNLNTSAYDVVWPDTQYRLENPLELQTSTRVLLGVDALPGTECLLTSDMIKVSDRTGATFSFAPITFVIASMQNMVVEEFQNSAWQSRQVGQTILQSSVDAQNVRVRLSGQVAAAAELVATNWHGGSAPTITLTMLSNRTITTTTTSTDTTSSSTTSSTTTSTSSTIGWDSSQNPTSLVRSTVKDHALTTTTILKTTQVHQHVRTTTVVVTKDSPGTTGTSSGAFTTTVVVGTLTMLALAAMLVVGVFRLRRTQMAYRQKMDIYSRTAVSPFLTAPGTVTGQHFPVPFTAPTNITQNTENSGKVPFYYSSRTDTGMMNPMDMRTFSPVAAMNTFAYGPQMSFVMPVMGQPQQLAVGYTNQMDFNSGVVGPAVTGFTTNATGNGTGLTSPVVEEVERKEYLEEEEVEEEKTVEQEEEDVAVEVKEEREDNEDVVA